MTSAPESPVAHPSSWLRLDSGPGDPAWNMALDEALLEVAFSLSRPVLRFYGWTLPAATFGYFQRYADVVGMTPLRPLIRRPTGGGLVPHEQDWTYSLVFPPQHAWYALRAVESYRRLHEWIQSSLTRLGVEAALSTVCQKDRPGQCFAGPERFDLVREGRKIAGAAQRRNAFGLLIQGSVQPPPPGVERADWEAAFCETARPAWGVQWERTPLPPAVVSRARELVVQKYATGEYNERR